MCGKNQNTGDNKHYGMYRGGSKCHVTCCNYQKYYCDVTCFSLWSFLGVGEKKCKHQCMGERGCLPAKGSGARY